MMERDFSIDELKKEHSATHDKIKELKRRYGIPKRSSDHDIILGLLKSKGVKIPRGIGGDKNGAFAKVMRVLANKHYYRGRMYAFRQEHPEFFQKRGGN